VVVLDSHFPYRKLLILIDHRQISRDAIPSQHNTDDVCPVLNEIKKIGG